MGRGLSDFSCTYYCIFLGNITFNCGESFSQLIINIQFDSVLRILLTENNRFELRNVGL